MSWAECLAEVCTLKAGACGVDGDCAAWESCEEHACTAVSGMCGNDDDCQAWQQCAGGNVCVLRAGMCGTTADCSPWQTCDAGHSCVLAANGCQDDAGCAGWQDCVSYRCATAPGFCGVEADCASWQDCGGAHTCVTATGYCADGADCAGWQTCGAGHTCATAPGFCAVEADCAGWQDCGTDHLCATAPGYCADAADCASWQGCGTGHTCETAPGFCGDDGECPTWKRCNASHACELRAGGCDGGADCGAGDRCGSSHYCEADPCQHLPPACTGTTSGFQVGGGPGAIFDGEVVVTTKFDMTGISGATTSNMYYYGPFVEGADVRAQLSRDPARPDAFDFSFRNSDDVGLTTGSYAMGSSPDVHVSVSTSASMYHGATCGWEWAGTFDVCHAEYGPRFGTNDKELLEFTASFSTSCAAYPATWSGCVHYVIGSKPGAFGPPQAIASEKSQICGIGGGWLRCWGWPLQQRQQAPDLMWPTAEFVQLSMGGAHGCAITSSGGVMCWGYNDHHQAGPSDSSNVWSPIAVVTSAAVTSIHAATTATYVVLDDGRIQFWGVDRIHGGSVVPADAFTPGQYVAFSGGEDFSCGLTPAGGVQCWGFSDMGQLGDGTIATFGIRGPVDVTGLDTGVLKISSQADSSCALQAGAVKCWGRNQNGQLGDGTTTTQAAPVTAALGGVATDVALSPTHACAVVDGGVQCWGMNLEGCLGDGTTTDRPTPDWVSGLGAGSGVVAVTTTNGTSCALMSDDTIWCWGEHDGDGVGRASYVPVRVRW
jgi:hypothetical protein